MERKEKREHMVDLCACVRASFTASFPLIYVLRGHDNISACCILLFISYIRSGAPRAEGPW